MVNIVALELDNLALQTINLQSLMLTTGRLIKLMVTILQLLQIPQILRSPHRPPLSRSLPDANAAEAGSDPGIFRISRTGSTTDALTVNYNVATGAGQATSADYTPNLTGTATIAAGQSFVDVTITPVDDPTVEGTETVTLTLNSTANYTLGAAATATVAIADNDTAVSSIDLSTYVRIGRYDLPEPTRTTAPTNNLLAQEVSAVTYNKDTDTLFVVGDGGRAIVKY